MRLYHYATQQFPELRTRKAQGVVTDVDYLVSLRKAEKFHWLGSYMDHVSFFFEPLEIEMIGKLFDNKHDVWHSGNVLYEHIVEVSDLPADMQYEVVESPDQMKLLESVNWKVADDKMRAEYFLRESKMKRASGEIGNTKEGLLKQIAKYNGTTLSAYKAAKQLPNWEHHLRHLYAGAVPHVMIYSKVGIFRVKAVNQVTVGSPVRARKPVHPFDKSSTLRGW